MADTYCTDADVLREDPAAAEVIEALGEIDFSRFRELVQEDIHRRLLRRTPSIAPEDLTKPTELRHVEVFGVLAKLYYAAANRPGDDDLHTDTAKRHEEAYIRELRDTRLSTSGGVSIWRTATLLRG
jgi:hypothetical protein